MKRMMLAAAMLWMVSLPFVHAAVVYEQPPVWTADGAATGNGWVSHVDTTLTGFRAYDNFSLGSAAIIDEVSWWGFYLDGNLGGAAPNTTDWIVRFQADNAGAPGAVLKSSTIPSAQVDAELLGTGFYAFGNSTVDVYKFTASFPNFVAAAATPYWFSPLSRGPDFSSFFVWMEGTGGDGVSFQTQSAVVDGRVIVVGSFPRDGDRAFALLSVPEPATPLLIAAGLAAIILLRRRATEGGARRR